MWTDIPTRPRARGQSAIDFVIGFGVFFIVLSFVLVVVPDLLAPFEAQEGPAVADRAMTTLTEDLLTTGGGLATLNASCTVDFFESSDSPCGFDGRNSPAEILGVSGEYRFNVTVEQNVSAAPGTEVVCYDGGLTDCSSGGTTLARGPSPPGETQTVRSARRVVRVGGETAFIKLRVW